MHQNLNLLLQQAIQLELNLSKLYLLFQRLLPDDSEFWWKLAIEEQNHAALLKAAELMMNSQVEIPENILPAEIEELRNSNQLILQAMKDFEKKPDRVKAFQLALEIEISAGEAHYNEFMQGASDSPMTKIFKKLNRDDVDHAERIRQYMLEYQIQQAR